MRYGFTRGRLLTTLELAGLVVGLDRGDDFLRHFLEVGDIIEADNVPDLDCMGGNLFTPIAFNCAALFVVPLPDHLETGFGFEISSAIESLVPEPYGRQVRKGGFRCVSLDRLATVLATGVDVEPSDSVIFVDDVEKASEYGGWPKVGMAFRLEKLKRSLEVIPADADPDQIAGIKVHYPHLLTMNDGATLRFSRIGEDGVQVGYEDAYGYWIPGDPFEALIAIFVFFRPKDVDILSETLKKIDLVVPT